VEEREEEIADSCEETAAILEGRWIQGSWYTTDDDGHKTFCLEGGLAAAVGIDYTLLSGGGAENEVLAQCPVYQAVLKTIHLRATEDEEDWYDDLNNWNDQGGRTEQEVLDILHATAKRVLGVEP
jgi:hypothetical protein